MQFYDERSDIHSIRQLNTTCRRDQEKNMQDIAFHSVCKIMVGDRKVVKRIRNAERGGGLAEVNTLTVG